MKKLVLLLVIFSINIMAGCNKNIIQSTPSERFIIMGDGTVADKKTGLIWRRCSSGSNECKNIASLYTFQDALVKSGKTYANSALWRLPNIKELNSIAQRSCINPALNTSIFPANQVQKFWSNTSARLSTGTNTNNYALAYDFKVNKIILVDKSTKGAGMILVRTTSLWVKF